MDFIFSRHSTDSLWWNLAFVPKAGKQAWEALIPIYNALILMDIIRRPRWWVILLFIPIINLMMFPVIWVETLRSFGKNSPVDTALGLLTFGLYTYRINYDTNVSYIENRSLVLELGLVNGSMHFYLHYSSNLGTQLFHSTLHYPNRLIRKNTTNW